MYTATTIEGLRDSALAKVVFVWCVCDVCTSYVLLCLGDYGVWYGVQWTVPCIESNELCIVYTIYEAICHALIACFGGPTTTMMKRKNTLREKKWNVKTTLVHRSIIRG